MPESETRPLVLAFRFRLNLQPFFLLLWFPSQRCCLNRSPACVHSLWTALLIILRLPTKRCHPGQQHTKLQHKQAKAEAKNKATLLCKLRARTRTRATDTTLTSLSPSNTIPNQNHPSAGSSPSSRFLVVAVVSPAERLSSWGHPINMSSNRP